MVRKKNKRNKFYYVQCGDWDGFTTAINPKEACIKTISQSHELFKEKARFTKVIICLDCDKSLNCNKNEDQEDSIDAFLVEPLLEEIHEY